MNRDNKVADLTPFRIFDKQFREMYAALKSRVGKREADRIVEEHLKEWEREHEHTP